MSKLTSIETSKGTRVYIKVVNTRMLTIQPLGARYEILDENGKLVGLNYDGEYFIGKGSVLTVGQEKYKISEIQKNKNSSFAGYELFTFRKISTTANFILPLLGQTRSYFRWNIEFVNAFIGTDTDKSTEYVHVLYRFDGTEEFAAFEHKLQCRKDFVDTEEPDDYHIIFKFKLPDSAKRDVKKILEGKYSEITEYSKQRIMMFHNSNKDKPIGQILYKCPMRRKKMEKDLKAEIPKDNELFELFNIENELYKSQYAINEHGDTPTEASNFI